MNVQEISPTSAEVQLVDCLSDLEHIRDKTIEAVLWQRSIPESVQNWLDALSPTTLSNGRFRLESRNIYKCITHVFEKSGYDVTPELEWLAQDIHAQAKQLSDIFSTSDLRLRVETVTDDACRRFHADNVKARLICTYSGPGTEYGVAKDGEMPAHIYRAPTGQPILLKGLKWSGSGKRPLRHRSPPIEGTGLWRLVIVIEPDSFDTQQLNASFAPFN